jgi:POT family proton-dependent oligopeptide transporter
MIFGACVLASGCLMLAIPFDSLGYSSAALGVIVVGNGLFEANAANLVRCIYEGDDARLDSAFIVDYMFIRSSFSDSVGPRWAGRLSPSCCCRC